jgi:hypothetical protein
LDFIGDQERSSEREEKAHHDQDSSYCHPRLSSHLFSVSIVVRILIARGTINIPCCLLIHGVKGEEGFPSCQFFFKLVKCLKRRRRSAVPKKKFLFRFCICVNRNCAKKCCEKIVNYLVGDLILGKKRQ